MGPELFTIYSSVTYSIQQAAQLYASYNLNSQEEFDSAIAWLENCINDQRLWMDESKLKLSDEKKQNFL